MRGMSTTINCPIGQNGDRAVGADSLNTSPLHVVQEGILVKRASRFNRFIAVG
jgi:hypothetical protein